MVLIKNFTLASKNLGARAPSFYTTPAHVKSAVRVAVRVLHEIYVRVHV